MHDTWEGVSTMSSTLHMLLVCRFLVKGVAASKKGQTVED